MNSIFEKYKWLKYLVGSFVVALGILVIVLACLQLGALATAINIVIAVAAMLLGVFLLITCILSETHKGFTFTLILSAALITAGIVLLITNPSVPTPAMVHIFSIGAIVFGTISLIKGISLIVYKERVSLIVLMFVIAVVGITVGIIALCNVNALVQASYILFGVLLIVAGILFISFSIITDKKKKQAE